MYLDQFAEKKIDLVLYPCVPQPKQFDTSFFWEQVRQGGA